MTHPDAFWFEIGMIITRNILRPRHDKPRATRAWMKAVQSAE
jgi:hypothetical protein